MAQGQIKKGFFFYFGLFVLFLITIFLICVVIMIFNPGKTVLWMQYFTNNDDVILTQTSDKQSIDWANVKELEINCSYADVTIEKDANPKIKSGINIQNHAKGFAVAKNAVKTKYSVQFADGVLTVNITEPKGFMYFSKSFKIVLHSQETGAISFDSMNIRISTTNGDVNLGGTYFDDKVESPKTACNALSVTTEKGDITFSNNFRTSSLTKLRLQTSTGDISSSKKIVENGETSTGLELGGDVLLTTNKGTINLQTVKTSGKVTVNCTKGNVYFNKIQATDILFNGCEQGNYVMNQASGKVNFNSADTLMSPNIEIGELKGSFTLSTNNSRSKPDIHIKHVSGAVDVIGSRGKLDVDEADGTVTVNSGDDMNVDVIVGENNNSAITIINNSGDVRLGFIGVIKNAEVDTKSSEVRIEVTTGHDFEARMYRSGEGEEENDLLSTGKISVNVNDNENKNPLVIGSGSVAGTIIVHTDKSVSIRLVDVSSLKPAV